MHRDDRLMGLRTRGYQERRGGRSLPAARWRSGGGSQGRRRSCNGWRNVSDRSFIEVENGGAGWLTGMKPTVAKRKTLFDDRPVEISELTYVIKHDLASLNQHIASLQAFTQSQHPKASRSKADQEGEHNDNVGPAEIRASVSSTLTDPTRWWSCFKES